LLDIQLPPGTHKFKAQTGPSRKQRKYFEVTVKAGKAVQRSFNHWPKVEAPEVETPEVETPELAPEPIPAQTP
jgi:hypothetical protein